jgi:hypothetical protein
VSARAAIALAVAVGLSASSAYAQSTAWVFVGESVPSGADEAFLRLGRARGAPVGREVPGQVGEAPRARLRRAVEAYVGLAFPDALARLRALENEVVAHGGAGLSRGELIQLFAVRAAARYNVGDEAAAWDDLAQVAAFAPARPLDPALFPPRVVEAERRAAEALSTSGRLLLSATPVDAQITVDGEVLGRGRVETIAAAGRHFVRAERAGFRAVGRAVSLGGDGAEVALTLAPTEPPTAELLARQGAVYGARRVVGAWSGGAAGAPTIELALVDVPSAQLRARGQIVDDARLTTGALAQAVDPLLARDAAPPERPPWHRRPLTWIVVGSVAAAAALAIGLGVGLSGADRGGFAARVDLGAAR